MLDIFLNGVSPAFLVIGVGALLGPLVAPGLAQVNRLALYGAVPALVFVSLAEAEVSASGMARLLVGHGLYVAAMYLLGRSLAFRLEPSARRGFTATGMFGNSANLMLPITLFTLGESALERAIILYVLVSILLYTLGPLVLAGREGLRGRLPRLLRLPVLWAAAAGLLVNLLELQLPLGIARGTGLLADAAIPLVLLILGVQVFRSGLRLPGAASWLAAATKLVLGPAVGFGAGWLVGARGLDLAVLTLLAAMPPAVNNLILALEFGGDAEQVARTIVLATLASLATVTVVVGLIS